MRFCFQPNDVDKSLQESVLADQRVKLFSNIFAPFNSLGILGDRESEIEGCMKNWCFGSYYGLYVSFNISLSHSRSLKVIGNRI